MLQPFNYDPNEKNKHKFMVQYLYLNDEEIQLSVNEILNMVNILFLLQYQFQINFFLSEFSYRLFFFSIEPELTK